MKFSTREKILQAAVELLEKSGIRSVTQLAVAKEVGIPQGQLTYHFPKRVDLMLAMTDLTLDRIAEFIWKKSSLSDEGGAEKVSQLVWELIRNHSRIRAMLGLIAEADENPEVRERLLRRESKIRALIAGALALEVDDPQVTIAHATMIGFGILSFLRPGKQENLQRDFRVAMRQFRRKKS